MTQIKIRAYYKYDGPTYTDPLNSKLSHEDVVHNLRLLDSDFCHALDETAKIEVTDEYFDEQQIEMLIQADCSQAELKSVIERVLSKAQLYGQIICSC